MVFVSDLLMLCFAAIGLAVLCYHLNNGRFRFYTIPMSACGFFLYRITLGRVVMMFSEGVVFLLRTFFLIVFYLFSRPFVIFARIMGKFFKKIYINLIFSIAKMQKILYNKDRKEDLLKNARKGFLGPTLFLPDRTE